MARHSRRRHVLALLAVLAALLPGMTGRMTVPEAEGGGATASQQTVGQDDHSGAVTSTNADADSAQVTEDGYAWTEWDESQSPNYVRLCGSADVDGVEVAVGEIRYSPTDGLGRAGRVVACVTYEMVVTGSESERGDMADPAGWGHNGEADIELPDGSIYHGWFWNRFHLLAKSLGGDAGAHNLVTGTRMENVGANDGEGGMAMTETAVRAYLRANRDASVLYVVTPVYEGDELVPRSVYVDVRSSDGVLDEEVEVFNAAKGHRIDYASGTFARRDTNG